LATANPLLAGAKLARNDTTKNATPQPTRARIRNMAAAEGLDAEKNLL
jgi:hypothetical protein